VAFAQKALSPAKVTRVQITDPEAHKLEVIVEDSQLSLAIGKKGQNVRLASKLIGWDIDIKSEEEKRREIEDQMTRLTAPLTPLTSLAGVGAKTIEKMEAAGINNVEALAAMTPEQLMEIPGIGEKMVDKIYQAVNRFYEGGGEAAVATEEGAEAVEGAEGSEAVAEGEQAQAEVAEGTSEASAETEANAEEAPANDADSASPDNETAGNTEEASAESTGSTTTHSEKSKHATATEDATESAQGDAEQPEEAKS
jgi:transcription termination/antitermination protein NusA